MIFEIIGSVLFGMSLLGLIYMGIDKIRGMRK
jgi:hypothetical protein